MICDLAETYHIFNYKELPAQTLATLVVGLRADSRLVMKLNNMQITLETQLLTLIHDHIQNLVWMNSDDGRKNRNRPKSLYEALTTKPKEDKNKPIAFDSGEDFDQARAQLVRKIKKQERR